MPPLKCIHCGKDLPRHPIKIVNITKGECAEFFDVDIGDSLSRQYPMHPDCANYFLVTLRITGIKNR